MDILKFRVKFKVKIWDKDENNKLMFFCIESEKLSEKYKTV